MTRHICLFVCAAGVMLAADTAPSPGTVFDNQLKGAEKEIVALVEAMPADKFDFAPPESAGTFKGVRTFGLQARHIATVLFEVSASILGEKVPIDPGKDENGEQTLLSKGDIVQYMKDSFAYAHKAMKTITAANFNDPVTNPFGGNGKVARFYPASVALWHSYDHYGQMVVYLRMNRIVPPASQPAPPPPAKKKP